MEPGSREGDNERESDMSAQLAEMMRGSMDLRAARRTLAALGDAALEPLVALLSDPGDRTRRWAAFALGALGDARAVGPLLGTLADPVPAVRAAAAGALGWLGDREAVPHLLLLLGRESDLAACNSTIWSLGRLGDERALAPLVPWLWHEGLHSRTAEALADLGPRSVPALAEAFDMAGGGADNRPDVRWAIVAALGTLLYRLRGAPDAPAAAQIALTLVKACGDPAPEVREEAAGGLAHANATTPGGRRARGVVGALTGALASGDVGVRRAAAGSLGSVGKGSRAAMKALLEALRDADAEVRASAALSLGEMETASVVPALLAALDDSEGDVRTASAVALGFLGSRSGQAAGALLDALHDDYDDVRYAAAQALGAISPGDERVVEALRHVRDHDNGETYRLGGGGLLVRDAATDALSPQHGRDTGTGTRPTS